MIKYQFQPFPILQSERLILRKINIADVNEVFALRSDPKTMKFIPRPLHQNHEDSIAHIGMILDRIEQNVAIDWAITEKGNDQMIGLIGIYRTTFEHFRAEVGYMVLPDFQGKGYVSEALDTVLEYAFGECNLHSIEAVIDPENAASEKVLLKNGFRKEAHFIENEFFDGKFLDAFVYGILNREFRKK